MDNSHPALNRILKQVRQHKHELTDPKNSMKKLMEEEGITDEQREAPAPPEDVDKFFTLEALKEREEVHKLQEKAAEEAAKVDEIEEKIIKQVDAGADPADIAPIESAETRGESLPEEVRDYFDSEKEEYSFHSCFDLRDFFQQYHDSFEDWAKPAIDSVIQAAGTVTSGCKCNLEKRRKMVEDYYVKFVTQNQHNSLIGKMKELLKTEKIRFYSNDELFLDI